MVLSSGAFLTFHFCCSTTEEQLQKSLTNLIYQRVELSILGLVHSFICFSYFPFTICDTNSLHQDFVGKPQQGIYLDFLKSKLTILSSAFQHCAYAI